MSLRGYLDKILNQLVEMPLSRQARMTDWSDSLSSQRY